MTNERLFKVLVAPQVSEKASALAESANQFVFKVLPDANKAEIKGAVEMLFDVKVESVQTCNVNGKKKRFGRLQGRRKNWKKAYVRLQEGQEMDFVGPQ